MSDTVFERFAVRVPAPAEALTLVTDARFRRAVAETGQHLAAWLCPCDEMVRYLELRYQQGWQVAAIRRELGLSSRSFRDTARCAHIWLWRTLQQQAPELACTFCQPVQGN